MPILAEGDGQPTVKVAPAAPFELMWVLHNSEADHDLTGSYASQEPVRQEFGPAVRAFWADGVRGYTEVVILAARSGTLLDLDVDRFFDRLDSVASEAAALPSLLSESAGERLLLERRLERLRRDADLRRRYRTLLRSVWEAVETEWDQAGRAGVVAAAERWRLALDQGASFTDLVERRPLWPGRPQLDDLAAMAAANGTLVLNPGWFYGKIHVVELDGVMYAGRGVRVEEDEPGYREVAAGVAHRVKALADPTRLSILLWLARRPASVTELARQFNLTQPTVSGHVQVLREAGLVDDRPAGRSVRLSASEDGLRRLFAEAEDSLVRVYRGRVRGDGD